MCTVMAVTLHYSWLVYLCLSACCCFHMFRVFTAKTRLTSDSSHVIARYLVVSLTVSALVVTTVVSVSLTLSDGQDCGYGKDSCYLDSTLLVGEYAGSL